MSEIKISNKKIGGHNRVFIVAELSANHGHRYDIALKTIKASKLAGADAVKLQTYTPDTITLNCANEYFRIKHGTIWDGKLLYELYKEAYTPWEWQPKLKKYAESLGLIFFSSPFDRSSVDFLEKMKVPAYKIASFEITDIPLIEYVALKGKPVIFSTGIAELSDIKKAVAACKKMGNKQIALLKCTSAYPAPPQEMNLAAITDMKKKFGYVVGLSDHSISDSVPIAAVSLGAKIIEKHIILDRSLGGPDAEFSLEPDEFKRMVDSIRVVEKALGRVTYSLSKTLKASRYFARSLFAVKDIQKNEIATMYNVRSIRPGIGLHPENLSILMGKKAVMPIKKGTPLKKDMFV